MNFNVRISRRECWSEANSKDERTHRGTYINGHGHVSVQDDSLDSFYYALTDPSVYTLINI